MADNNPPMTSPASSLLASGRDEEQGQSVEKDVKEPKDPPAWTPLALRRWVFIALALLFAALFVVIEVLFRYSNKNDGLSTNSSTNHYLWTYGPTAVFMLISAIWNQIEYRTKQLAPWAALHSKPDIARKTILLDYISLWNVVALFRAGRNSHWPVVMAIIGTLVLQLVAVASTGLLTLETVFLPHIDTTPFSQSKFNLSDYNKIQQDGVPQFITVAVGWKGLDYPVGTTAEHAFQPFNVSSDVKTSANSLITAEVDVFTPDLYCEVGEVVHQNVFYPFESFDLKDVNITISAKSCPGYLQTTFSDANVTGLGYHANVEHIICNGTAADNKSDWIVFMVAHWNASGSVDKQEVLACAPTYNITRQSVSITASGQAKAFRPISSSSAEQQSSPSPIDLSLGLLSSLETSKDPFWFFGNKAGDMQGSYFDTFFTVANLTNPHSGEQWIDQGILENEVKRTFRSLMVQVARRDLMRPSQEPLSGYLSANRERLIVRELSVRIMEASLIVLILICAGLSIWRPVNCTPRDPGSILAHIILLDRSPQLARVVGGITSEEQLQREAVGKCFRSTIINRTWRVDAGPVSQESQDALGENEGKWWQPWSLTWFGRSLAIVMPLLLIIGLEVTFQESHRLNGLGTIGSNEYIQYTWAYLPAALMMAVRIIYEGIFSSAKILQPYLLLKNGAIIADDAITDNSQAKLAVQSVWKGLSGHFGVGPAAFATIIAPLLTIVASGLYSAEDTMSKRDVQIERGDAFNSSFKAVPYVGDAADTNLISGLIVTAGIAYPKWTHEELALSALQPSSLSGSDRDITIDTPMNKTSPTTDTDSLQVTVPALRGNLDCLPMVNQSLLFDTEDFIPYGDYAEGCERYGTIYTPKNAHIGGYFGMYDSTQLKDETCSRVVLNFGYLLDDNSTDQIHSYACNATIDILDVNVTFSLPDYTIINADPIESSRQQFIPHYEPYEDNFMYMLPVRNDTSKGYDEFWSAVMEGNNITTTDLTEQPLKVVDAATHTFRILLAQTLSSYTRIPINNIHDALPGSIDTRPFTRSGTLTNPNVTRLKQSAISTRILEGLLAGMVVSCAVAFYFLRSRDILPLSPCSIATVASYLVPSQLVGEGFMPAGAEFQRKSELVGNSWLGGLMLSLGWWKVGDGEVKRYGIDIGKAG